MCCNVYGPTGRDAANLLISVFVRPRVDGRVRRPPRDAVEQMRGLHLGEALAPGQRRRDGAGNELG